MEEMLKAEFKKIAERFDKIDASLNSVGEQLADIDTRLEELSRIDRLEHRFEKLREKLNVEV